MGLLCHTSCKVRVLVGVPDIMTFDDLDLAESLVNCRYKLHIYRKYRTRLDICRIAFPTAASSI